MQSEPASSQYTDLCLVVDGMGAQRWACKERWCGCEVEWSEVEVEIRIQQERRPLLPQWRRSGAATAVGCDRRRRERVGGDAAAVYTAREGVRRPLFTYLGVLKECPWRALQSLKATYYCSWVDVAEKRSPTCLTWLEWVECNKSKRYARLQRFSETHSKAIQGMRATKTADGMRIRAEVEEVDPKKQIPPCPRLSPSGRVS